MMSARIRKFSPRSGSNLAFGPGGHITIVSDQDNSQPAVVGQNLFPQDVHSIEAPSQSAASQPLLPSTLPQPTISPILGTTTPTRTAFVESTSDPSLVSSSMVASISPSTLLSMSVVTSTSAISSLLVSSMPETSALVIASSTTLASPESASPSTSAAATATATSTSHSPSFYVGIVVGTIIILACLAALVAWWIRIRSHARRRRLADDAAGVPWAKTGNNGSLEDGRDSTFIGSGNLSALGPMNTSSQNPMAWEPRGDRDVGEPKRTESFLNAPISPTKRSATPYNPFAQYPVLADSAAFPLPLYNTYSTMRLPPSHLSIPSPNVNGSVYDHASVASLGLLQVANRIPGDISVASSRAPSMLGVNDEPAEFGTPIESMTGSRPRFLGLEGGGLRVPWAQTAGSFPRGMSFTSRRGGDGVGTWERLPPLPMPGDSTRKSTADPEGWTASLKTNLMNAFNAVAAGLPSAPTMEERQENYLTPRPARHASHRGSFQGADRNEMFTNRLTRESTASSKSWTMEERLDGTGTVHFHGLEGYRGGDHAFSPLPTDSSLTTLQDGSRSDIGASIFRMTTHESQTPLIVNRKPKAAVLRPGFYGRISQYGYGRKPGLVSRASSVYSTVSGTSSVSRYPSRRAPKPRRETVLSRNSTRTSGISSSSDGRAGSRRSVGETRLTSTDCSFRSYRSDGSVDEETEPEETMATGKGKGLVK